MSIGSARLRRRAKRFVKLTERGGTRDREKQRYRERPRETERGREGWREEGREIGRRGRIEGMKYRTNGLIAGHNN